MSSHQGLFESDADFQKRVAMEADERTIKDLTGNTPSKGLFESEQAYMNRIANEANEQRISESTGSAPSRGFFESDDHYSQRIAREANERTVRDLSGSGPIQGWFESDDEYDVRVRREANEQIVKASAGESPTQKLLEGDHDYRSRVAHEARLARSRGQVKPTAVSDTPTPPAPRPTVDHATPSRHHPCTGYEGHVGHLSQTGRPELSGELRGIIDQVVRMSDRELDHAATWNESSSTREVAAHWIAIKGTTSLASLVICSDHPSLTGTLSKIRLDQMSAEDAKAMDLIRRLRRRDIVTLNLVADGKIDLDELESQERSALAWALQQQQVFKAARSEHTPLGHALLRFIKNAFR